MHAINRIVNVQAIQPPMSCSNASSARVRSRSRRETAAMGVALDEVHFPEITRDRSTIDSRSASAPGLTDQCGGMMGSSPPPGRAAITSASRSIASVTHGGGRSPDVRSAVPASAIGWLAFKMAIRCIAGRIRPPDDDRTVSSAS